MGSDRAIIIFIKNSEAGHVKTRIAREVGDQLALEIYTKLSDHTRTQGEAVDACRYLYYSKFIDYEDGWSRKLFEKKVQKGRDLGQRMEAAFAATMKLHEKAIIIGSDCPGLTANHINKAFDLLDKTDVVFGPSFDGGYYLLGMSKLQKGMFRDMPWSTPAVLEKSLSFLKSRGLSYGLLEPLPDVDYFEDWEKYGWA